MEGLPMTQPTQLDGRGKLRDRRRALGMTMNAAAQRARISREYWSMIERGRRTPSPQVLVRMAEALDCDPRELFDEMYLPGEQSVPPSADRTVIRAGSGAGAR